MACWLVLAPELAVAMQGGASSDWSPLSYFCHANHPDLQLQAASSHSQRQRTLGDSKRCLSMGLGDQKTVRHVRCLKPSDFPACWACCVMLQILPHNFSPAFDGLCCQRHNFYAAGSPIGPLTSGSSCPSGAFFSSLWLSISSHCNAACHGYWLNETWKYLQVGSSAQGKVPQSLLVPGWAPANTTSTRERAFEEISSKA